jgi:predicted RNase H-like nuclease (RuvC/YqgF family)
MANRLQEFGLTNSSLRSEIAQAWDSVRQVESDRDSFKAQVAEANALTERRQSEHDTTVRDLQEQLAQAHAAIAARDGHIKEISDQLHAALTVADQEKARPTTRQCLDHWQLKAADFSNNVERLEADNTSLRDHVYKMEASTRELEAKLAKVRSVFESTVASIQAVA